MAAGPGPGPLALLWLVLAFKFNLNFQDSEGQAAGGSLAACSQELEGDQAQRRLGVLLTNLRNMHGPEPEVPSRAAHGNTKAPLRLAREPEYTSLPCTLLPRFGPLALKLKAAAAASGRGPGPVAPRTCAGIS